MKNGTKLAQIVYRARTNRQMSNRELAARSHVSAGVITRIENDGYTRTKTKPTRRSLIMLADTLNLSAERLFRPVGYNKPYCPRLAVMVYRAIKEKYPDAKICRVAATIGIKNDLLSQIINARRPTLFFSKKHVERIAETLDLDVDRLLNAAMMQTSKKTPNKSELRNRAINTKLAAAVKKRREEMGLTQKELSQMADYNIVHLEQANYDRRITKNKLVKVGHALGLDGKLLDIAGYTRAYRLGNRLVELRNKKFPEHNQSRVAVNVLGVNNTMLSLYETGEMLPGKSMLQRFAEIYEADYSELEKLAAADAKAMAGFIQGHDVNEKEAPETTHPKDAVKAEYFKCWSFAEFWVKAKKSAYSVDYLEAVLGKHLDLTIRGSMFSADILEDGQIMDDLSCNVEIVEQNEHGPFVFCTVELKNGECFRIRVEQEKEEAVYGRLEKMGIEKAEVSYIRWEEDDKYIARNP